MPVEELLVAECLLAAVCAAQLTARSAWCSRREKVALRLAGSGRGTAALATSLGASVLLCCLALAAAAPGAAVHLVAAVASALLLATVAGWRESRAKLWQPALLSFAAAGLSLWACIAAALRLHASHDSAAGSGSEGWLVARLSAATVVLLAVATAADVVAAACLGAACVEAWASGGSGLCQPLLAEEEGRRPRSKRFRLLFGVGHYVWPDSLGLQLRLLACFALVLVGRVTNILIALAYKHLVDTLGAAASSAAAAHAGGGAAGALRALCAGLGADGAPRFWGVFLPWVAAWLALSLLQGSSSSKGLGLLSNGRDLLFIPIQQRAAKRISLDVFNHLLQLDHAYHLHRKTGKVMRILDRGTSSCQDLMEVLLFQVGPQLIDVAAACAFIALRLEAWVAVIVLATVCVFVPSTLMVTEWRGKVRKRMNKLDDEKEGKAADMLLNYETVKLFTAEEFELRRYGRAIDAYQAQERLQLMAISYLNMLQGAVVFAGLAAGLGVCVRAIVEGRRTVGDAVLFLALMNQLLAPLSFFGSYYRQIQKGLVDCENMLSLLHDVRPGVADAPGARPLEVTAGAVEFDAVTFSYGPSLPPVLRGVSFAVPGGKTLGLVGATGSGKSSILRLLLRFWDPQAGRVLVDGQDIARCTVESVRRRVAVVPQDAVLFAESMRYNIRYGRPDASQEELEAAAARAQIHDAIVGRFPAGYDTLVGERGLRLSGGEKQRVAFVRTLLREPAILILDEATSALDSVTERAAQAALAELRARGGMTQVIVAHRLSTVADADVILVIDGGEVAEQGTFAELLQLGGRFATMWARQQEGGPGAPGPEVEQQGERERQQRGARQERGRALDEGGLAAAGQLAGSHSEVLLLDEHSGDVDSEDERS